MLHRDVEQQVGEARALASRLSSAALWLYACLGLVALAHLLTINLDSNRPALLWLSIGYGWWIALSFMLLQVSLGRRLLGSWLTSSLGRDALTIWLACFTTGFWLSAVAFILLAGVGLLDGVGVALYLLASAIFVFGPARSNWRSLKERFLPPFDGRLVAALIVMAGVMLIWLPFFIQTLLPNSDWDAASTHLPLATWLRDHGLSPIPVDHANLIIPGTVHLVYAVFVAIDAEQAIIPFNFVVSVLTCLAVAALASRFWGKAAGWWGFGVCLSINLLMELGLDARIDGFLAFFCTMGALGIMVWLLEGKRDGALLLASMALGLALGTKYTAFFPLLFWGAPVIWGLIRRRESAERTRGLVAALAVVCVIVPSGYWYASNAIRFGDPLYPRLRGHTVTLENGSEVMLADAVDELIAEARQDPVFVERLEWTWATPPASAPPRTLLDPISVFLQPDRHARKEAHFLSPLLLLCFLLPVVRRDRASWLLSWMSLSVFLAIGAQTYLVRYGLISYPLLAVAAGAVLAVSRARAWRVGWGLALALVLFWNVKAEWSKLPRLEPASWLAGERDRIGWLSRVGYNRNVSMPLFIGMVDELQQQGHLPDDGKILMLGEAKTHLLRIESIPDISRVGQPWLARLARNGGDLEGLYEGLWAEGVRYVLVNVGHFEWVKNRVRVDRERIVYSLHKLEQFNRLHGEVVFEGFGMLLVRIDPPRVDSRPR